MQPDDAPMTWCSVCGDEMPQGKPWKLWCNSCLAASFEHYELALGLFGALSLISLLHFGTTPAGWASLVLLGALCVLGLIDFNTKVLPDDLTFPLIWAGLAVNLFGVFTPLASAVMGAMAGYLLLWVLYWVAKLLTGQDALGYGDFKLLAALGAWLGWYKLTFIFLGAGLLAGCGVLLLLLLRRKGVAIPFGPYLALAGCAVLFL